ncbi:peptidoglycan-associated lipoprotein [Limnohabitans sp. MORI2]|jgi:peptidoglycan-associated lipoprotein|uniref:peptidoglycan-associated lipoprotein Pal n=1 Tax=Limnohabitans sp. MORI2 TaxID=1751150 RepID=UPI00237731C5|nr:peptidoglycan-associated lipoprotein Pal [Limnohabitans sp. MORI2]BDU57560.1 peptidoglycan-associated lipoprotein [Limnohabitans sp. MORI2]
MSKRLIALLSIVSVALLSACSSTKLDNVSDAKASSSVAAVVADHLNPNSAISKERSVYFGFDQFDIKADQAGVVERQGKYLAANAALKVRIEGNADERGGREYNLALGQKRAEAVARGLKAYGVKDGQVEPVSFGSEKPKAEGHDEAAWAQNRRADVAYTGK